MDGHGWTAGTKPRRWNANSSFSTPSSTVCCRVDRFFHGDLGLKRRLLMVWLKRSHATIDFTDRYAKVVRRSGKDIWICRPSVNAAKCKIIIMCCQGFETTMREIYILPSPSLLFLLLPSPLAFTFLPSLPLPPLPLPLFSPSLPLEVGPLKSS